MGMESIVSEAGGSEKVLLSPTRSKAKETVVVKNTQ